MFKKFILICCLIILLLGCKPSSPTTALRFSDTPESEIPKTVTQPVKETDIPTKSPSATNTQPASATNTVTYTQIATETPEGHLQEQCIEPVRGEISETNSEGLLVIAGYDDFPDAQDLLWNPTTESMTVLPVGPNNRLASFAVSPNRELLAYIEVNPDYPERSQYIVLDSKANPIVAKSRPESWYSIVGWLDNETLMIDLEIRKEGFSSIFNPVPLVLWYPFSDNVRELSPDYPGIYNQYPYIDDWGRYYLAETVYDPTLRYVVYPFVGGGSLSIALWDVDAGQQITSLPGNTFYGSNPTWSPDGEQFLASYSITTTVTGKGMQRVVHADEQEIFSVAKDGEVTRLTYLSDIYEKVDIGPFSWSPDGQSIAFWVRVSPDIYPNRFPGLDWVYRLAILDRNTGVVRLTCLSGEGRGTAPHGGTYVILPGQPIWSPDSSQLTIEEANPEQGSFVTIVDVANWSAVRIADNMTPMGWMVSPKE